MKRLAPLALAATSLLCGCGNGDSNNSPDMSMGATPPPLYVGGSPTSGMAADESCLGTRMDPAAPDTDQTVSGTITDFQDGNIVTGATVKVYLTPADVPNSPAATSAPSDAMGHWTVTVPKGHYRVIFGNDGGKAVTMNGMVDTIPAYEFNRAFNDPMRSAVKVSTRDEIPGLVSVVPDPSLGVLAGSLRDCQNAVTGGGLVTVSGTSMPYDSASLLFYFVNVAGSTVPTRTQHWTASNGLFAALNVPVGTATVSATGIVGSGAARPLGSETVPIQPGAITIVDILPQGM